MFFLRELIILSSNLIPIVILFFPFILITIYIIKSIKNKNLTIKFPLIISIYFVISSIFYIYFMIDSIGEVAHHGDVTGRTFVIPLIINLIGAFVLWFFYSMYNIKINKTDKNKMFPLKVFLALTVILGIYFYFLIMIVFK